MIKAKKVDLKHDIHILWSSIYYMIAGVLEQQQSLCAALLALNKR